jgi:hypothetical protein
MSCVETCQRRQNGDEVELQSLFQGSKVVDLDLICEETRSGGVSHGVASEKLTHESGSWFSKVVNGLTEPKSLFTAVFDSCVRPTVHDHHAQQAQ